MFLLSCACVIAEILDLCLRKTTLVSLFVGGVTPRTLTIKNISDALYAPLKSTADAHGRSLNSEVIVCLESVLLPQKLLVDERLARARQIRQMLADVAFSAQDIAQFRRVGRP